MLFCRPLPFVELFIEAINEGIKKHDPRSQGLSFAQRFWLKFCLMGAINTNSICWSRFERSGLGRLKSSALSWIFWHSVFSWDILFQVSVFIVLEKHGITTGELVIDDSEKKRSKVTTKIAKAHKIKDKTTGGYINGQNIIFLLLVTDVITIPVGFAFYEPDPARTAWIKKVKALRKLKCPKEKRPQEPQQNPKYPKKWELALRLLKRFQEFHSTIRIKCILADALYGNAEFVNMASKLFNGVQVISQIHNNQNIRTLGRIISVKEYFTRYSGVTRYLIVRGGKKVKVVVNSARLVVCAHNIKRFIVALKYEGESEYRYLIASNLSWRTEDIMRAYTLRWLVEVFFQDWKAHEGWGALTKQPGEEGSSRSLILSLLVDHCLLLQPDQLAQLKRKQPAFTVGSLVNRIKVDSLLSVIQDLLSEEDPKKHLAALTDALTKLFELRTSEKHMVGRDLGRLEPSPSLKYRAMEMVA